MKKYVLPLVVLLLLVWLVFSKVEYYGLSDQFVAKQDSLVHAVDSLIEDNHQKNIEINALHELDYDLELELEEAKSKVKVITKWVDSSKKKVDTWSEKELISSFYQRYPEDTATNPLPVAQPVLVSTAKDLIELDGAKQTLVVKDSIISLNEQRIAGKDSIISLYVSKEVNYNSILTNQEIQIEDWKKQYKQVQVQNKKLKVQATLGKIGTGIALVGLTFLLVK